MNSFGHVSYCHSRDAAALDRCVAALPIIDNGMPTVPQTATKRHPNRQPSRQQEPHIHTIPAVTFLQKKLEPSHSSLGSLGEFAESDGSIVAAESKVLADGNLRAEGDETKSVPCHRLRLVSLNACVSVCR